MQWFIIIIFVPGPVLEARNTAANKQRKCLCPRGAYIQVREVDRKLMRNYNIQVQVSSAMEK